MYKLLPLLPFCITCTPMESPLAAPPATAAAPQQINTAFSAYVLGAISNMPQGGGYSGTPATVNHLVGNVIAWNAASQQLNIRPNNARPSFCSGACYLVLLQALQQWEHHTQQPFSAQVWQSFAISPDQADGHGIWGRANANGPGFAKLVTDLHAGINFTDYRQARAGDFLKIFWTPNIGATERGHLVVYLGTEQIGGQAHIRYWSANKPGGYGVKTAPLSEIHHPIFTRITRPQNFANTVKLPPADEDLAAMLSRNFTYAQILKMCKIPR
ncbi:MAG: hypothetical protein E7033_01745 [Akkermansiaceae bacterium]|nr:hypothetical protein [Akkermansiaceae bacterium]